MKKLYLILLLLANFVFVNNGISQALELTEVASGFTSPTGIFNAGDGSGSLYVTERPGVIRKLDGATKSVFLDITAQVYSSGSETGLLGLAFHPDFEDNGYFYINYTIRPGTQLMTRISRFQTTSSGVGNPGSETILLEFDQPYSNHNGGSLLFGTDGYLYISTGDGGSSGDPQNNAQNTQSLLGKMLRIDVDNGTPYGIPDTNPFYNDAAAGRPEIFAWGLRNPWKVTMDRETGEIYIGDVGQGSREEIDILENGGNFGWRIMEGNNCYNPSTCDPTGLILPIYDYSSAGASQHCSVTGGYVYRGSMISELEGQYIFGDYCSGVIWALTISSTGVTADELFDTSYGISSFGEDEEGEVYVVDINGGRIYKITGTVTGVQSKHSRDGLKISPNPANDFFSIDLPEGSDDFSAEIFDIHGKFIQVLHPEKVSKYKASFSAAGLATGIYTVKVLVGQKDLYMQKLIVND